MYRYVIHKPYWKYNGISVDLSKCNDAEFEVSCTWKTSDGKLYFPGVRKVKRHIVELMKVVYDGKCQKQLKLIPFEYLKGLKNEEDNPEEQAGQISFSDSEKSWKMSTLWPE